MTISILCAHPNSSYYRIPGLEVFDSKKDAFTFSGRNPVITHAPCQNWSRMRKFSNYNLKEKLLADWCFEIVNTNGGIFEHPAHSSFWKHCKADKKKIISIDQCWFGFPGRKSTWLYFHRCSYLEFPILRLPVVRDITQLHSSKRSLQPFEFSMWLVNSVNSTFK